MLLPRLKQLSPLFVAILWLCISGASSLMAIAQDGGEFKARLSPVPLDLAMQSTVAGSGSVAATLTGRKLVVTGKFEGLRSPATTARVHRALRGLRGPAGFDLAVSKDATNQTSGGISGSLDLTPAQMDDLVNGRLYVQLNSEGAPEGNLRGWLLR